MSRDVDYGVWSPYTIDAIASPAVTAPPDVADDEIGSLAGSGISHVPIPEGDEYYDVEAGTRRPMAPEQVVPADRPLLAAIRALVDHPFLLVTRGAGGDDPENPGEDPEYLVVTPADLNRRTAEAAFYPVLSALADRIALLIEAEFPESESLVPLVGPFPVGTWTKARAGDVDVHIAEFLSLTDMIGVVKGRERLLDALGYEDPDELESDLYGVSDLRNRVMHGNRSLVLDPEDVAADLEALDTAIALIDRIDERDGVDRSPPGPF